MKKSFKYILLILMISFIIAILCCRDHSFEQYASYPFKEDEKNTPSIDSSLQEIIFKYNTMVDEQRAGGIQSNERGKINKGKKVYQPLTDNQSTEYAEYESILDNTLFKKERIKPKIKTEEVTISLDADIKDKVGEGGLDSIQERNIEGEFYFEGNRCKGGWSPWNKESCGGEKSRCGIQFKKYEIIEIEKNDKNGPGKPCDYKDGEIKYRYCVGTGNDDYESNQERCSTPNNSCPCKLNGDSVMVLHGENVYDLEDENCLFEKEVDCICPPGFSMISKSDICKLTAGVDCSIKEPGCIYTPPTSSAGESCKIPDFINEETKKNFYKKYSSFDGKCKERTCTCGNGHKVPPEKCFSDGLELCDLNKKCNDGYYYEGNPPTCKKQTTKHECSCLYGTSKIETSERCKQSSLDALPNVDIRQNCGSCLTGYALSTNSSECNEYYPEVDNYNNINCCIPKFDRCEVEEDKLIEGNIDRREVSNEYREYIGMSIGDLFERYNSNGGTEELNTIVENIDPKQYLIQKLIEQSSDNVDSYCRGRISFDECVNSFRCKPGYSFLPKPEFSSENELRMISCEGRNTFEDICEPIDNCERKVSSPNCKYPSNSDKENQKCTPPIPGTPPSCDETACNYKQIETHYPVWNGTCVPVTCPVSTEIKEIYNIPYDSCSSDNENCGLSTITCTEEQYNVPNTNKMLYCSSPSKVGAAYQTTDYELVHSGCSKTPPPPTVAEQTRTTREAEESEMVGTDDAALAAAAVSEAGITTANIETAADFTGTTSQEQLELATALEETRQQNEVAREEQAVRDAVNEARLAEQQAADTDAVRREAAAAAR